MAPPRRNARPRNAALPKPPLVYLVSLVLVWPVMHWFGPANVIAVPQPKRPSNGYMLWLGENRPKIVKKLGKTSVSEVAKAAGEEWKGLTPKKKDIYQKKAGELKSQYEKDMEEFLAQGGVVAAKKTKKEKDPTKTKKEKDPNQPKRPLSSYMLWLGDNREKIKKEIGSDAKPSEVLKAAGVEWKNAKPATKQKYEKAAEQAKEEHKVKLEEYTSSLQQ